MWVLSYTSLWSTPGKLDQPAGLRDMAQRWARGRGGNSLPLNTNLNLIVAPQKGRFQRMVRRESKPTWQEGNEQACPLPSPEKLLYSSFSRFLFAAVTEINLWRKQHGGEIVIQAHSSRFQGIRQEEAKTQHTWKQRETRASMMPALSCLCPTDFLLYFRGLAWNGANHMRSGPAHLI